MPKNACPSSYAKHRNENQSEYGIHYMPSHPVERDQQTKLTFFHQKLRTRCFNIIGEVILIKLSCDFRNISGDVNQWTELPLK